MGVDNFPSMLRHCWFVDRNGIQPVKKSRTRNPQRFFFGDSRMIQRIWTNLQKN